MCIVWYCFTLRVQSTYCFRLQVHNGLRLNDSYVFTYNCVDKYENLRCFACLRGVGPASSPDVLNSSHYKQNIYINKH